MGATAFPPSPTRRRSPLPILFLTVFVDMVGFGIVVPVLPLYTERFGASPWVIGLLLGIYSAMGFLFSPVVGALSDRFGRKGLLLLSTGGQALGFGIMGAATTLPWLFFARGLDGIFGANVSVTQAYVADVTAPESRAEAMGWLGAAFGLGFICGPLLGGLLSRFSLAAPFFFAGALALVNAFLIALLLPESLRPESRVRERRESPWSALGGDGRLIGPLAVAYFFAMFGFAMLTAFFAVFTEDRFGFGATENGYVFAMVGIIAVLVQSRLIGPLTMRFDEKRVAVGGTAILAASLFALPLVQHLSALFLVGGGIAVGNSLINPTVNSLASRSVDERRQGTVLGLLQAGGSMGRFLGPIAGGLLLELNPRHGPEFGRAPFWVGGGLLLVALGLTTTVTVPARATTARLVTGD